MRGHYWSYVYNINCVFKPPKRARVINNILQEIRTKANISQVELAKLLGSSLVSVDRWERGASEPSPEQIEKINDIYKAMQAENFQLSMPEEKFMSRGIRNKLNYKIKRSSPRVVLSADPGGSILDKIRTNIYYSRNGQDDLNSILGNHDVAANTISTPPESGMSAGKNTYTYDAHTYHTKVPPQGIAELLRHYLPDGGLVLDSFSGSGMTGVAARINGCDSILNELSPAACFISNRFVSHIDPELFRAGVDAIVNELSWLRKILYTTKCRECGKDTEILYTVWSYNVICNNCFHEFTLWDHCRQYGRVVREHKILREFPCPKCHAILKKSTLKRTKSVPVFVGYKCCKTGTQENTCALNQEDLCNIANIDAYDLCEGYYPSRKLYDGVNLRQPTKHGIDSVDKFYTKRNLLAMSYLWKTIHCIDDPELAAHIAFVFTSLYQRVTRFSEFRFWGGSGNTARFNVPYIFNEANVFLTFLRKAKTIQDHLESTSIKYRGKSLVVNNSATSLGYLPDESVDLIFTDPPFGGNINYSEMNIIWESWLGSYTDNTNEAIINKYQGKSLDNYKQLMTQSLNECFRVLRTGHWLLLVFMNSSKEVWSSLRSSILEAGFDIIKIDIFDKQHGTFKHFVSENTAGSDLVLHCFKPQNYKIHPKEEKQADIKLSIWAYLTENKEAIPKTVFMHVNRDDEIDYRKLYSDWLSSHLIENSSMIGFPAFRFFVDSWIQKQ
jgi:DNA modification methylase